MIDEFALGKLRFETVSLDFLKMLSGVITGFYQRNHSVS